MTDAELEEIRRLATPVGGTDIGLVLTRRDAVALLAEIDRLRTLMATTNIMKNAEIDRLRRVVEGLKSESFSASCGAAVGAAAHEREECAKILDNERARLERESYADHPDLPPGWLEGTHTGTVCSYLFAMATAIRARSRPV